VVRDPNIPDNQTFTRSGAFRVQDGYLTNPEGYIVQGYEYNYDATTDPVTNEMTAAFGDISVKIGQPHPDTTSTASLESVSVDSNGIVTGKYTDGSLADLFCVQVAKFDNPSGLTKKGSSMFAESRSSGDAVLGVTGGTAVAAGVDSIGGTIYSSTLEMSNVDIAQEFVKMITTQRGFQASSKIITTTDELLNEVINLKR
jgi:flagellar hook protein FlgE